MEQETSLKFKMAKGDVHPSFKNQNSRHQPKLVIQVLLLPLTSVALLITICLIVDLRISKYTQRRPVSYNAPVVTHDDENERENYGGSEDGSGFLRLPKSIRPFYYTLSLLPRLDLPDPEVTGYVSILVNCLQPTSRIVLHAHNVTVTVTRVRENKDEGTGSDPPDRRELEIENTTVQDTRQFFVINLKETLEGGKDYEVKLNFSSVMGDDNSGFYRSSYLDQASNATKYLGLTQFEPTDARSAFPCFDEPAFKAIFQINIARKKGMSSISNSPIQRTRPHDGLEDWFWDEYEPTLPMSTYLLAFVVSEFVFQEARFGLEPGDLGPDAEFKTLRLWSRPDVLNQTNYALRIAPQLLDYFEGYFQVKYPLSKMDLVAAPEFKVGGMENWGLVIVKETELLFDPSVTSKSVQNTIASTISHEMSHQWFGDLVTPRWWSDLWLNEGFASYFEYVGVTHVEPDWEKMNLLLIDEMQEVMDTDVLDFTRPISIPVEDPDDVEEQFDGISYSKGSAIIAMLNAFLTPSTFQRGLQNYLNQWKYNNTVPDHLWNHFTLQAHADQRIDPGVTVADIMSTWTLQRGFPLIHVTRNYDMGTALFTQSKYSLIRDVKKAIRRWWVPLSYATPRHNSNFTNSAPAFWITPSDETVEMKVPCGEYEWLLVNVNGTGYYRVNFDMRNWQMLANQLKAEPSAISVLNRAQLLDDCLSLGRASLLPYAFVLSFVEYLRRGERHFTPWQSFLNGLQHIYNMLQLTPSFPVFQTYVRRVIAGEYSRIFVNGSRNETFLGNLHQQGILLWATSAHHPLSIQMARAHFLNSKQAGRSTVPPNFRKPMYCSMVEHGGEEEWSFLWSLYRDGNLNPGEMKTLIQGLACTNDLVTLNRMLDMAQDAESEIREEHGLLVVKEVAINPRGTDLVFKLLCSNWTSLQKYFDDLSVVVTVIGDQHNQPEHLTQWLEFKGRFGLELGAAQRSVYQSIEKVRSNIHWMKNNYKSISNLLNEYIKDFHS